MSEPKGKVVILGQGYVGLPLAMLATRSNWNVVGLDISNEIVESLNLGFSHIEDVSNQDLRRGLDAGLYRASIKDDDLSDADICIICVPTPLTSLGTPDLSMLEAAIRRIAKSLKSTALLINESTSYPGTLREFIVPLISSMRLDEAKSILFASAPERIDPRNQNWRLQNTPRVVSGIGQSAIEKTVSFYESICERVVIVSTPEVAELAKLMENTFRQVNIALVNQLVPFCNRIGVDIHEVLDAAESKPYGFMRFNPGAGVGGHCIPIDPMYLLWRSRQLGLDLPFIDEADRVNKKMPSYVASRLIEMAKPQKGDYLAILGVGYKKGISDIRETPAISVGEVLLASGFKVVWSDPLVTEFPKFEKWDSQDLKGAVVITAQPGLPVSELISKGIAVLDCTGELRHVKGVQNL